MITHQLRDVVIIVHMYTTKNIVWSEGIDHFRNFKAPSIHLYQGPRLRFFALKSFSDKSKSSSSVPAPCNCNPYFCLSLSISAKNFVFLWRPEREQRTNQRKTLWRNGSGWLQAQFFPNLFFRARSVDDLFHWISSFSRNCDAASVGEWKKNCVFSNEMPTIRTDHGIITTVMFSRVKISTISRKHILHIRCFMY